MKLSDISVKRPVFASVLAILIAIVGIVGFLSLTSPEYICRLTQSTLGLVLVGLSVVMLGLGALWLRKLTRIAF